MDRTLPRFARVFHTVTIEIQVDLAARTVFQVLIDHTAPLRACGLALEEDEERPALPAQDERLALDIAARRLTEMDDEGYRHPFFGL